MPSMRNLIVLCMIVAGVVPLIVSSVIVSRQATGNMESLSFALLESEVQRRKQTLDTFLRASSDQAIALSESLETANALQAFQSAAATLEANVESRGISAQAIEQTLRREYLVMQKRLPASASDPDAIVKRLPRQPQTRLLQYLYLGEDPVANDSADAGSLFVKRSDYEQAHSRYHGTFAAYARRFGFRDLLLIEPDKGQVVYSASKGIDFGTSLLTGEHRDSGLATIAQRALTLLPGQSVISDFSPYLPAYGAPAAFVGAPVYRGDTLLGALVLQMPIDTVSAIMAATESLGETGDTLLIGADDRLRSTLRAADGPALFTPYAHPGLYRDATEREVTTVTAPIDGVEQLVAFTRLQHGDLQWTILAEIHADEVLAGVNTLNRTALLVAAISIVLVAVFAYLLGRQFVRQLGGDPSDIGHLAHRIGQGDLGEHGDDNDRLGAYAELVGMRHRLRDILADANIIATQVRNGAIELSRASLGLSERTEQQSASLEETASSTEELTSTVRQNVDNLRAANGLAIDTRDRAVACGEVSDRAATAMTDIQVASESIADIIGVIDEIAFQTNLLALNAAVEAARAGEQGRGFAVVASEVRQLAGRSASAAREIKDLIEDSTAKVAEGSGLVRASGEELREIVNAVTSLTDIVGQISVASEEQSTGIEQINHALVAMDGVTHQNSAMVIQATATSRTIVDQAENLLQRIRYFSGMDSAPLTDSTPAPAEREVIDDSVVALQRAA